MASKIEDILLTPEEVAKKLKVQKSTIYQWTHAEYIPHIKLKKNIRFRESAIDDWLDEKACQGRAKRRVEMEV